MDLFVLDSQLRRVELLDQYESLIWTERYAENGDFQLDILTTRSLKNLLIPGTRLAINQSRYVMVVETIEDTVSDEGQAKLVVSGRSLEAILDDRSIVNVFGFEGSFEGLTITGPPMEIANELFDRVCRNNDVWPEDKIEYLQPGKLLPSGNVPMNTDILTMKYEKPESLYSAIKNLCDTYNLGFRLIRNGDRPELYFEIYTGFDRTPTQNTLTPVVFSPELDNLTNLSSLTSIQTHKNVAYVFAKNGSRVVYEEGTLIQPQGFNRRVLVVDATDIDDEASPELDQALLQRGLEELAKNRSIFVFDGEISQQVNLTYSKDYGLGDLVQIRNTTGEATNMRVVEQIFARDEQGMRSYPTFAIDKIITPGSWDAWDPTQVWDDVEEMWAQL